MNKFDENEIKNGIFPNKNNKTKSKTREFFEAAKTEELKGNLINEI
jgi:hypothetical protein